MVGLDKALALVSGGVKSAVLLASQRASYELHPLYVATGAPDEARVASSLQRLATAFGLSAPAILRADCIRELDAGAAEQPVDSPGRQYAFFRALLSVLGVVLPYAYRRGLRQILIGVCGGGTSPAHDFFQVFNELLGIVTPEPTAPSITAPLTGLSYPEVIKLGHRLRVPFEFAWSCEGGGPAPCGSCPSCISRATAFLRAGILDPLGEPARLGM